MVALGQPTSRIEDGLSNTIAFSEVRSLNTESDERGAWALPWAGASLLSFDMHPLCFNGRSDLPRAGPLRAEPHQPRVHADSQRV